jgi:acyl-coenzyme A thioesterase 9
MAARNAATLKSQRIAPLKLSTEAERRLFEIGEEHKMRKMQSSAASLEKVPPTKEEALLLHKTFLKDRARLVQGEQGMTAGSLTLSESAPSHQQQGDQEEEIVTIASTMHSSTIHMHPQQANVHLKVFGGVMMRHCYELGWITAAIFANQPVEFLSLDALSFHSPVPIGALLSELLTSWEARRLGGS